MRIDRNTKIYLGQREIVKIKKGNVVIWESQSTPPVVEPDYFYIQNLSAQSGNLSLLTSVTGNPSSGNYATTVEYSTDKENWTTLNLSNGVTHTITLQVGEKVYFRNDSGKWNYWTGDDNVTDSVITNFSFEYDFNVGGNINTLLDYTSPNTATLSTGCFAYLFKDVASLVLAKYLTLPATTLAPHCYRSMFNGCTDLVYGPQLPATTLAEGCYRFMFYNCNSMHYAPALPATTLAAKCYHTMFYGCSRITEAPTLSVTTLAPYCYDSMFQYCTALEAAPALPATTLTPYCYYEMFRGCSSLETAPTLPAQTLAQNCYQGMFKYCSSLNIVTTYANNVSAADCITDWLLDVAPTGIVHNLGTATYTADSVSGIPTGWIEDGYFYMENISQNDTNLNIFVEDNQSEESKFTTSLEYSRDKSTWNTLDLSTTGNHYLTFNAGDKIYFRNDNGKFNQTFNGQRYICFRSDEDNATGGSILTLGNYRDIDNFEIPSDVGIFGKVFNSNSHLKDASHLVISRTADYSYVTLFEFCTALTIPPALVATEMSSGCYHYMFSYCTSLTTPPALPATTMADGCYQFMFDHCTSLTTAPELPATALAHNCYSYMFDNCTSLTTTPSILPGVIKFGSNSWDCWGNVYEYMFRGCTALTTAPILPQTEIGNNCYLNMFDGCTALTTAPALPATTLKEGCYAHMFQGCTALTTTPELPATSLATSCYQNMFDGCTNLKQVIVKADFNSATDCITDWLKDVAATGTFINLGNATYTQDSGSGIPTGWTEDTTAPVYTDYIPVPNTFDAKSWMDNVDITHSIYGVLNGENVPITTETTNVTIGQNTGSSTRTLSETVTDSSSRSFTVTINQTANDTEPNYFYIENLSEENTLSIDVRTRISSSFYNYNRLTPSIEYSTDKQTWTKVSLNWKSSAVLSHIIFDIPVNGGRVYFRNDTGKFSLETGNSDLYGVVFFTNAGSTTTPYRVGGDLRTLLNYKDVENAMMTENGTFNAMFYKYNNNYSQCLVDASDLVLPTYVKSYCYSQMFQGCALLETAPKLPAKTLEKYCYSNMFSNCTALTTAPALPATTLANYCYSLMFYKCTALTTPPALPATTLADHCYEFMFVGCTALTVAPELPATTLSDNCYKNMFKGCTALTTAPSLPATTLADYCYQYMFQDCTSLTSVTIYATSTASSAFVSWLNNVAASGTVNNNGFLELPENSPSGIPSGWTEIIPTIQSITANPDTFTLKSYQTKVRCESTLTITSTLGTTVTKTNSAIVTVGENTGDSTRTLTETIDYKGSSYQVTIVQTANDPKPTYQWDVESTGTYPFQLNSNNYYESTNKGHDNSYSYATLTYEGYDELVLECINFAESNYDYGIISQPDVQLSESTSDDGATGSANVFHNFKGQQSANPVQLTIPSDGGSHFITIKFRKDSSASQGNDSLQFKVVEP